MKVHEIMTAHARSVGPDNTLVEAAGLMRELDVGALPVCDNERLTGMVTDRDMVLRGAADGRDPNTTTVREVMSQGVVHVAADQEVEDAARLMEQSQIRRLPVVGGDGRLVGIVSLGDIAISSNPAFSGMALRDVSEPSHPTARQRRLTQQSEPTQMPAAVGGTRRPAKNGRGGKRGGTRSQRGPAARKKSSRERASTGGGKRQSAGRGSRAAGKTSPTKRSPGRKSTARSAR